MASAILFYIISLASIAGISSGYSIPFRRPCKDLSPVCLKDSIQAAWPALASGVPELGIDSSDPFMLKKLNMKLPGGINVNFYDGYAKGLKDCKVDFARYEKNTFEIQLHCNVIIKGKYKSSARVFLFPIHRHGEATIKCNNIMLHSTLKLGSKVKSNGQRYLDLKSSSFDHRYDGRVSYGITNLSPFIVDYINNDWRTVAENFGTPIVKTRINSVLQNLWQLFEVLSIDELKEL